ncbi:hypothetical protein [Maribacter sp.]
MLDPITGSGGLLDNAHQENESCKQGNDSVGTNRPNIQNNKGHQEGQEA